jgi:GNAT superfamily N-acetyltransferase
MAWTLPRPVAHPRFPLVTAASLEIRAFRRSTDLAEVAALWTASMAPEWPVLPDALELLRSGYAAWRDGRCVGVIGVAVDDQPVDRAELSSSIRFIAVAPDERRQGIATRLVEHALGDLRRMGVTRVAAGSGAGPYIWPGVPLDRPDGVAFFASLGWEEVHVSTDLTADLQQPGLDERLGEFPPPDRVRLAVATPAQRAQVVAFEEEHFPHWARWFREPGRDILLATDEGDGDTIAGALLLTGPGRANVYWPMLGEDSAEIACVGVAPSHENLGLGSAMVAHATGVLRQRGARLCHIGWVARVDFYRRVGYTPWRAYSMRQRAL